MTTPETQEVATGITEDEAASQLLAKWTADDDETQATEAKTEEEAPSEQSEQVEESTADDAEDGEAEAEEKAQESGDIEISLGGETFKVPAALKETAAKLQKKAENLDAGATRKFQEAAELRKAAEAQIEIVQAQADLIADHKMVERRLAAMAQIDINALAESDPVQLTKLNAEYNQLVAAKANIERKYQLSVGDMQAKQKESQSKRIADLNEFAKKNVKGWGEEYSNTLLSFAVKDLGFAPDALRSAMSESLIKAIDLAYQGHKVRTATPRDKVVNTTKTIKPGALPTKTTAHVSADKAFQKARSSGRTEDAAMALLARASIRKR